MEDVLVRVHRAAATKQCHPRPRIAVPARKLEQEAHRHGALLKPSPRPTSRPPRLRRHAANVPYALNARLIEEYGGGRSEAAMYGTKDGLLSEAKRGGVTGRRCGINVICAL